MAKKFYTVIVVPHAKAKFHKLKVPYNSLIGLVVLAVGLFVALGFLGWRFMSVQRQSAELLGLRQENFLLKRENEQTRRITSDIEGRLAQFQDTVSQFKIMFGVQSESSSGVGDMEVMEKPPADDPITRHAAFSYQARLKAGAEALAAELDGLRESVEEKSITWRHTPSTSPLRNGFISSGFGMRTDPFTGKRVFHPALDISSWYWEEVYAPADGLVTRTERSRGSGLFIELSHGYGYTTVYAHLKKWNVKEGQKIGRGDVIGYVGNTGRSTGPHLHYEVRYQDRPVNPRKFMLDAEAYF